MELCFTSVHVDLVSISSLYRRNLQEANLMECYGSETDSLGMFNIAYRTSLEEEAKNSRQLG
jgi:hypothetical protein